MASSQYERLVFEALKARILSTPAPTAPIIIPAVDEILGLALLDAGIRFTHIRRIAETLEALDKSSLIRSVEMDLDTSRIPPQTRSILSIPSPQPDSSRAEDLLWIPIARHNRRDQAPVDVVDSGNRILPRMSHRETIDLLTCALIRLFRMILRGGYDLEVSDPPHPVEGRAGDQRFIWCLESAIVSLINDGLRGGDTAGRHGTGQETGQQFSEQFYRQVQTWKGRSRSPDHAVQVHKRAIELLEALFPQGVDSFLDLLAVAAEDYLLVVAVPDAASLEHVKYSAPLLTPEPSKTRDSARNRLRGIWPAGRDYIIDYQTTIPWSASSFHLSVSVDSDVQVRGFILDTDVDQAEVNDIQLTLRRAAQSCDRSTPASPAPKLVEHELQALASRVGALASRRMQESAHFETYVSSKTNSIWLVVRSSDVANTLRRLSEKLGSTLSARGRASVWSRRASLLSKLYAFGQMHASGDVPYLVETDVFGTREALTALANQIAALELGSSISVDNDPRENGAHAHWKRPRSGSVQQQLGPVLAQARIVLADESPALGGSVALLTLALVVTVYGVAALLLGNWTWFLVGPVDLHWYDRSSALGLPAPHGPIARGNSGGYQADAVVAVLLLVPSLLLARLDIPRPDTVLGQLRLFPRRLAYTAVALTGLLALIVASRPLPEFSVWFADIESLLLLILAFSLVDLFMRLWRRSKRVPSGGVVPCWLRYARKSWRPLFSRPADVTFTANSEAWDQSEHPGVI